MQQPKSSGLSVKSRNIPGKETFLAELWDYLPQSLPYEVSLHCHVCPGDPENQASFNEQGTDNFNC